MVTSQHSQIAIRFWPPRDISYRRVWSSFLLLGPASLLGGVGRGSFLQYVPISFMNSHSAPPMPKPGTYQRSVRGRLLLFRFLATQAGHNLRRRRGRMLIPMILEHGCGSSWIVAVLWRGRWGLTLAGYPDPVRARAGSGADVIWWKTLSDGDGESKTRKQPAFNPIPRASPRNFGLKSC